MWVSWLEDPSFDSYASVRVAHVPKSSPFLLWVPSDLRILCAWAKAGIPPGWRLSTFPQLKPQLRDPPQNSEEAKETRRPHSQHTLRELRDTSSKETDQEPKAMEAPQ